MWISNVTFSFLYLYTIISTCSLTNTNLFFPYLGEFHYKFTVGSMNGRAMMYTITTVLHGYRRLPIWKVKSLNPS